MSTKLPRIPEGDDQRQHARSRTQGVTVTIGGDKYDTINWSPGGFTINNLEGGLNPGDRISGDIELLDYPGSGKFEAVIVRTMDNGLVAAKFSELSATEYINMCLMVSHSN